MDACAPWLPVGLFFSTLLAFFFKKSLIKYGFFGLFCRIRVFMSIWQISRHCPIQDTVSGQNDKFSLDTLHKNL